MKQKIKENKDKKLPFIEIFSFVMHRWVEHPKFLLRTLSGVAFATIADIVTPVLAGRLVGDISHPIEDIRHIIWFHDALWMLFLLIILGLVGVLGRRSSYLGISHLTLAIMRKILGEGFARVQKFSSDWHGNNFAGSTVRRLTRGMWAVDSFNDTVLLLIIPEVLVLIGTTIVLAIRAPLMGAVLGVSVFIFATLSIRLALFYVAPASRLSNQWDTKIGATLSDSVTCHSVVKSFGAEKREEKRLERTLIAWSRRTLNSWVKGTNSANLQASLSLIMRMALIGLVIFLWWHKKAGPGDVAYVLTMAFLIQGYLRDLGQQVSQVQRSVNEMEELVLLFQQEEGIKDKKGAKPLIVTQGDIIFEDVSFRYQAQSSPLYHDFNLKIEGGTRLALVGASGSGKTSLTRLIQRLYDVHLGRILIDGQNIAEVAQESLRKNIALVPQEPILFHRSLAENIAYGRPTASFDEIREAARLANAHIFIDGLEQGYATMVGERGVKLSGGERQRVAIARAFLMNAPLVIFDEATASLDSHSERLVQEAMARLMKGRTVIVVAHRLSTVRELDRILVFEKGRIIEDGTHEGLMEKADGAYRHLVELQSLEEPSENL